MEQINIKPGDVVRLKTGGPVMIVENTASLQGHATCVWFDLLKSRSAADDNIEIYGALHREQFQGCVLDVLPKNSTMFSG